MKVDAIGGNIYSHSNELKIFKTKENENFEWQRRAFGTSALKDL